MVEKWREEIKLHVLKRYLTNLMQPLSNVTQQLRERKERLQQVVADLKLERAGRRKTETLGTVVEKIVCTFRHEKAKNGAKVNGKIYLETVTLFPFCDDLVLLYGATQPGTG